MSDDRPLLLLTRPRLQSDRFARALSDRVGQAVAVLTAPVMEIELFDAPIPLEGVGGLVFTSENGVAAYAGVSDNRTLPAYCVGDRTARAARAAGLRARSARGTAVELIQDIAADPPGGRLLHLRGEHARGDVCGGLAAQGIDAADRVVYAQRALPFAPDVLQRVAAAPLTLLPLFSPRSAQLVAEQLGTFPNRLYLVTMSAAVTEAWTGPDPDILREATRPDAASMLDALAELIDAAAAP
ncbi:MAG: uroporphyrinogen-III synthase [Rhodovulum sp.]